MRPAPHPRDTGKEDAGGEQVFLPFCCQEAAANLLTNEALDPDAKIPAVKFCAARVEAAGGGCSVPRRRGYAHGIHGVCAIR